MPAAINFFTVTNTGTTSLTFSWGYVGIPGIEYDTVEIVESNNSKTMTIYDSVTPELSPNPYMYMSGTPVRGYDQTITVGASYSFTMIMKLGGVTQASAGPVDITISLPPFTTPTLNAPAPGNSTVGLSWTNVGAATYDIIYSPVLSGDPASPITNISGTSTTISPLTNGQLYTFQIKANGDGINFSDSPYSAAVTATPTIPSLSTPTLNAYPGNTVIDLSWNFIANATGYEITYSPNDGTPSSPITINDNAGPYTYQVTSLTNGTPYSFNIKAIGDGVNFVDSSFSTTATATPAIPQLPAPVVTAAAGSTLVDLSWNQILNASGYEISFAPSNVGDITSPITINNNLGPYTYQVTPLTNGTLYSFYVKALGDGVTYADSPLSTFVTAMPLAPALPAPTGLTATAGNTQVDVSWNAVSGAVSYTLAYESGGPGTIVTGVTSPYTVSGLTNGITYNFAVSAAGDGVSYSDSPLSSPVTATPFAPAPAPICFLGNAPVLTPGGWRRIDSLLVGDLVRTADGRDVAVQRVKHQRIERPSAAVNPYVIPAGSLGATENLLISPQHCVAVPGRGMVEARRLGLRQMPMRTAFDYYNLELPEWDNMIVAGVEVESLATKKQVVMSKEDFARFVSMLPPEKRAILGRQMAVLADGRVVIQTTRKERRTSGRT